MFPTLYEYQSLGIHSWGLMVMSAFLAAALTLSARAGRVGIDADKLVPFYMLITVAGLLGARLLHFVFAETADFFADPGIFFDGARGGFAFYGGVIGGVLAGVTYARLRAIPVWKLCDAAAPTIMLGLGLGRVGCFLAGCCHGAVCNLPAVNTLIDLRGGSLVSVSGFPGLALVFKAGVGVGAVHGIPLYPTQVWESLGAFALFAGLSWMWARARRFDGQVLATMLVAYAALRSLIEEFRGDSIRGVHDLGVVSMSTSQLVAVGMVVTALIIVAVKARGGVAPEVPFVPDYDAA